MIGIYLSMLDREEDKATFLDIYNSHKKTMYYTAYKITGEMWAEDAVHEAFIKIMTHIEQFNTVPCNEWRALCVIIVRNVALNILRKEHREVNVHIEDIDEDINFAVEDEILSFNRINDIVEGMKSLSPLLSDVLIMRLVMGFSTKETASMLSITEEAVKTRLSRGKTQLKKIITKDGERIYE